MSKKNTPPSYGLSAYKIGEHFKTRTSGAFLRSGLTGPIIVACQWNTAEYQQSLNVSRLFTRTGTYNRLQLVPQNTEQEDPVPNLVVPETTPHSFIWLVSLFSTISHDQSPQTLRRHWNRDVRSTIMIQHTKTQTGCHTTTHRKFRRPLYLVDTFEGHYEV